MCRLLDTPGALGTHWAAGRPLRQRRGTASTYQEAQIPSGEAIVFCLAQACDGAPKAEDVVPVILRPGFAFVIHRGVWHSASHGIGGAARYYWQAWAYVNEPTVWEEIEGGPVRVEA